MCSHLKCECPYIPCGVRGNCEACVEKNRGEKTLPNCMEEIAVGLGAKLPVSWPETEVCRDYEAMSRRCAELVKQCLEKKADSLLCFPAGSTVVRTCEILQEMQKAGQIDFSRAEFVALDEWLDLENEEENCTNFMKKNLYEPLGIGADRLHLFQTDALDLEEECRRIDEIIFQKGGIDIMLLGLGMNGHLGLNEPGDSFDSYAKPVTLSETTMDVGQKYFSAPVRLTRGITLGVRHMFETKSVLLQVSGEAKKDIVARLYQEQPSCQLPGTVMKLLEHGLIVLDEAAAGKLEKAFVEKNKISLTA